MKPIFKPKPPDDKQAPGEPFAQTTHGMPVLWQIMNQNQKEEPEHAGNESGERTERDQ